MLLIRMNIEVEIIFGISLTYQNSSHIIQSGNIPTIMMQLLKKSAKAVIFPNKNNHMANLIRYKNIFMYSSLQFCGNIEEYFSKHTEKLVVFITMPRLKNKDTNLPF